MSFLTLKTLFQIVLVVKTKLFIAHSLRLNVYFMVHSLLLIKKIFFIKKIPKN